MEKSVEGNYLKEKVDEIKEEKFHPKNFREFFDLKKVIIIDAIINRKDNTEHYLKFAEIVKDQPYFRLDHIDQLELPYDILIFVSEKNIGKSRQMLVEMEKSYKNGKKFVIMRSLDVHIQLGLYEQLSERHSAFHMGTGYKIYHKSNPLRKGKEDGIAMSLNTCTKWKGASFDDYEFIWYDEATDEHKDIGVKDISKFFISVVNSIERRKDKFKVIITGNTDYSVSHPLFEFFEIDPSQNLVYTTRKAPGADQETKILYINSRGLYAQGAKSSKFIGAGGDPKAALDAFMNSVKNNTDRLVAIDLTYLAEPAFALVFKDNMGEEWQLVVAKHKFTELVDGINNIEERSKMWYYLKIEPFQPEYLYGYRIFTNDVTMHTLYRAYTVYKKTLTAEWGLIRAIIKCGNVIFVKKETKVMLFKLLDKMTKEKNFLLG